MLKLTDKVKQYNSFNKEFDFTYMFSDDHRVFNVGDAQKKRLDYLYSALTSDEKDLVGLYNNHVLKRDGQFGKPTISVPNTYEEAVKYYPEIWKENNVYN